MALKFFNKLSQNFTELLNNKDDYNEKFTAHSNVLKCRSPYFDKELDTITPNEKNIKIIIKPNISAQIFDIILRYIYSGIVNLENVEARIIFDLMLTANEFKLEELSKKLETILIKYKASWLKTHFSLVYRSIFINNNFNDLENFCNDIITKNPNLIFDAEDFTSLQESALQNLGITVKWGIAQNPTLPTNLEEWSTKNFLTLETTLQQCLPHIRYFHIPGDDILDKVKPYKKILDKQLWKDLMKYLISPNQPLYFSLTICLIAFLSTSLIHTPLINTPPINTPSIQELPSNTIISDYRLTPYSSTNYPGSRDGFAPHTFWNMCHGYSGTVVIIKVKGTDEILGGYNPLNWDNIKNYNTYKYTPYSFIFSLKNGNIKNSILSRVIKPEHALYYYGKRYQNKFGPYFGACALCMYSSASNFTMDNDHGDYEKSIRTKIGNRTTT
ncbi:hypothetical protein Glove_9g175 [Diversispora epigaea]|uniref:BTB domain-containing protein n=1 Tax=Diversispora epigaea TaxID=1348612 RepID=A0A397JYJ2_9GLOM|nr:hypothetical protein Glove_9g175 [Diversispora epigaea]